MKKYDVLVLGILNPDIIVYTDKKMKRWNFSKSYELRPAGPGGNIAIALARLGAKTVIASPIGNDIFGKYMVDCLRKFGVETNYLNITSKANGMFTIWIVRDGKEQMVASIPSQPLYSSVEEMLSYLETIPKAKISFFGHWFWDYLKLLPKNELVHKLFKFFKDNGILVALDINYKSKARPSFKDLLELRKSLEFVDVLLPNIYDAQLLVNSRSPKKIVSELLKLGPRIVCLKMGAKGCYVASENERVYVPTRRIDVKNTVGAGDVFGAAFIYGLIKKWSLQKIGKFANEYAAYFLSKTSLEEKYPTLSNLYQILREAI